MPELRSRIFASEALSPAEAERYLAAKLAVETDPSEVAEALEAHEKGLVVIDARRAEGFAEGHIPGALNFTAKDINAQSTSGWDKDALYVTYCGGLTCRASAKAAIKLAGLGFKVKEIPGGIKDWQAKGHAVVKG
jgi:rhodanese-related sulfurtransferase